MFNNERRKLNNGRDYRSQRVVGEGVGTKSGGPSFCGKNVVLDLEMLRRFGPASIGPQVVAVGVVACESSRGPGDVR